MGNDPGVIHPIKLKENREVGNMKSWSNRG
jgi:hypothetical protein